MLTTEIVEAAGLTRDQVSLTPPGKYRGVWEITRLYIVLYGCESGF